MKRKKVDWQLGLFYFVFLVPGLLLYLTFYYLPNVLVIPSSFFHWNIINLANSRFVGTMFYERMWLERELMLRLMRNNIVLTLIGPLVAASIAMLISGMVTHTRLKKSRDVQFYRSVMYFPNVVPPVALAMMWLFIYQPGSLTQPLLDIMGIETGFLAEIHTVRLAIIMVEIWGYIGFYFIIILAAMSNVPLDFYEASSIDGAGTFTQFFKITLPLIAFQLKTLLILIIARVFAAGFITIQTLTAGGPNRASEILTSYMYRESFMAGNFGFGASVGTLIFGLSILLYIICTNTLAKGEAYEY